jgi:hypothetical protein
VKAELFGFLELYSEVKVYGKDLLRMYGHGDLAKAFANFQAYIRQGKTFYQAGDVLHHRASPLLYYYAFMNFGKALALLKNPSFRDDGLMHGLEYKFQSGRLRGQFLRAKQHGVFPALYSAVTGKAVVPGAKLKILDMLGYNGDVGFEYQQLKLGQARFLPVRFIIVRNATTNQGHSVLAVARGHAPKTMIEVEKRALSGFTEVTIPVMDVKGAFGIPAEEQRGY